MYMVIALFNVQLFFNTHTTFTYIHGAVSFAFPFQFPLPPLYPVSTYLAPSSCDRNCPPPSQVAGKLTLFAPPFTQLSRPFPTSQNPNCPAPDNDDLGTNPLLLCGTCIMWCLTLYTPHLTVYLS
jgi:hypothetical protein